MPKAKTKTKKASPTKRRATKKPVKKRVATKKPAKRKLAAKTRKRVPKRKVSRGGVTTLTKTKVSATTKVLIAIAGAAIILAAAAVAYQVDRNSYQRQDAPAVSVQRIPIDNVKGWVRSASMRGQALAEVNFTIPKDIESRTRFLLVFQSGVDTSNARTSASIIPRRKTLITSSGTGRTLSVIVDGRGEGLKEGDKVKISISGITYGRLTEPLSIRNLSVSAQFTEKIEEDDGQTFDTDTITGVEQIDLGNPTQYIPEDTEEDDDDDDDGLTIGGGTLYIPEEEDGISLELGDAIPIDVTNQFGSDESSRAPDEEPGLAIGGVMEFNPDLITTQEPIEGNTDEDSPTHISESNMLEIIEPNGGEAFIGGEYIRISWDIAPNKFNPLTVSYTENKGKDYKVIASNIPARSGALLWKLPIRKMSAAKIRIEAKNIETGKYGRDDSDKTFTVGLGRPPENNTDEGLGLEIGGVMEFNPELIPISEPADNGDTEPIDDTNDDDQADDSGVDINVPGGDNSNEGSTGGTSGGTVHTDSGYNILIKTQCPSYAALDVNHPCKTVYYYSRLGSRHAFPNAKAYFTWYPDFSNIVIIDKDAMASIPLGKNVTYKPGVKMVKFQSLNTVYAVSRYGYLLPIDSEAIAAALYGINWNKKIDDISDAFFGNYKFGSPIMSGDGFNIRDAIDSVTSINDNI